MAGHEVEPTRQIELADGSLVPESIMRTTMLGLKAALSEHGPVAAIDLEDLAHGRQPQPQPFGDTRSTFLGVGLCNEAQDGKLQMHDLTADVVRNAIHVNPQDAFDFRFVDPQVPFAGFDAPQPGV